MRFQISDFRWAALVALLCVAAAGVPQFTYGEPRQLCVVKNARIRESSGIAASRVTPGVFWTHNDAGDTALAFAFNLKGEDLGTFPVPGARATDWEDIASFRDGDTPCLLIADVGDNVEQRKQYTLYLVEEPRLGAGAISATKPAAKPVLRLVQTIPFVYEDGPHNCEAVAVDAPNRTAYLITKRMAPQCKAYALPLAPNKDGKPVVAKAVATIEIPVVTAMDISADNQHAVVLTYGNAYEFTRGAKETWGTAFSRKPREITMPPRRQGESICYGADGRTLYLTSEGECPLWEVPVKRP